MTNRGTTESNLKLRLFIKRYLKRRKAVDGLNGLISDAHRSNYDILVVRWSGLKVKPPEPLKLVVTNGF